MFRVLDLQSMSGKQDTEGDLENTTGILFQVLINLRKLCHLGNFLYTLTHTYTDARACTHTHTHFLETSSDFEQSPIMKFGFLTSFQSLDNLEVTTKEKQAFAK